METEIQFFCVDTFGGLPPLAVNCCYLIRDSWDDWFEFDTRYRLVVFDGSGAKHLIGEVKIGQAGLKAGNVSQATIPPTRVPAVPPQFPVLSDEFFSIGQEDDYYEGLSALGQLLRERILRALRDCAFDLSIFRRFENERVMQQSLLRYLTIENVLNRLHRLANGNAILTRYHFEYSLPAPPGVSATKMSFLVQPNSHPPTNVHVLIGRNGVGKSRCIQGLTSTVLELDEKPDAPRGTLTKLGENADEWAFAGLVHVSFSAFDSFAFPPTQSQQKIRGTFVGLSDLAMSAAAGSAASLKELLGHHFVNSFENCRTGLRTQRWRAAVEALCSDPMFEEANAISLLDSDSEEWRSQAERLFRKLSSGHAIVLLTATRLVELVDERTLVILDEPEGHLHPPLLSAFIRAVSNLLIERNGVAIIATHSPVVLQEVPASCVSVLSRSGAHSDISPPPLETFGESVGVLTRQVFDLEVTKSGFHAIVRQKAEESASFEALLQYFSGQLGSEAQLLARSLIAARLAEGKS
ncbi:AAA family ATPase [Ralstonia pseudosolanacearum]|uniref:AAA family ATPase n=1 Tax=Ralstonia pseudosolanacearum TaxID=1310165 RepID=UPI0018A5BE60|nr:AAA family ATPase [Ralstonia pseudosolanacearum]BCL90915.1 hypothetical protein MAFF211479_06160 [Ralstonia solanacearum]BCN03479.1 hypothetical protein RPSB_06160 [Ralstonia solanacearum]